MSIYNFGSELVVSPSDFDHASWNKTATTIASDTILNSDTTSNVEHNIFQIITGQVSAQKYRLYAYANASEVNWIRLQWANPPDTAYHTRWVNLTTGALGTLFTSGVTVESERIIDMLDGGWAYEAIVSRTIDPTSSNVKLVYGDADADTTRPLAVNDGIQLHEFSLKACIFPTIDTEPVAVLTPEETYAFSSNGVWNGAETIDFQWYRYTSAAGAGEELITGETKTYHEIVADDIEAGWIRCLVQPSNDIGAGPPAWSNYLEMPGHIDVATSAGIHWAVADIELFSAVEAY